MYSYVATAALLMAGISCGVGEGKNDEPRRNVPVAELLEDNAEALLKKLTNPTGDSGEGHVEKTVVFSGKSGVKIIPMQRFEPVIPGWKYRIVEKPKVGEYRYLRFAWKADGCAGIMLQLHDEKDWHIRYTAGIDQFNWGTTFVADKPPAEWKIITRDLFKDFGERTITGIALTAFGGRAAYFDHIYFGRSVEDLDRIDATGLRAGKAPVWKETELDRFWSDLSGNDESVSYRAFWSLVASPKQAVPLLRAKLSAGEKGIQTKKVRQWIKELDDDNFRVRERATKELARHIDTAAPLLERELESAPSAEVRARIERLLAGRRTTEGDRARIHKAIGILEYARTPECRKCLEELAKAGQDARLEALARDALKRMDASAPR